MLTMALYAVEPARRLMTILTRLTPLGEIAPDIQAFATKPARWQLLG